MEDAGVNNELDVRLNTSPLDLIYGKLQNGELLGFLSIGQILVDRWEYILMGNIANEQDYG